MTRDEPVRILCVDDEHNVLRALERTFLDEDYQLLTATTGAEGLAILEREAPVQVVLSDYRMPELNGVEFLREVCHRRPETVRIVLSGYADTAAVIAAINDGQIYKFIPKPWNDDELKLTIAQALEKYFLEKQNRQLVGELRSSKEGLSRVSGNMATLVEERLACLRLENQELGLAGTVLRELPLPVLACDSQGVIVLRNRAAQLLPVGEVLPAQLLAGDGPARLGGAAFRLTRGRVMTGGEELLVLVFDPVPGE
ncbi:MAG: response regulator [Desulfuromonadales bacterium]|nr:response regulator [Desulfuromonadales bacterium]